MDSAGYERSNERSFSERWLNFRCLLSPRCSYAGNTAAGRLLRALPLFLCLRFSLFSCRTDKIINTRLSATSMHTRTRNGPRPGRQRQKFRLRRAKILSKNGSLTSRLQQKLCLRLIGLNTVDPWLTVRRSDCASANARQVFPLQERRLPHDEQRCTASDLTCRQTNNGLLRRTLDKTLQLIVLRPNEF